MPDLADIPGLSALRSHTKGDPRLKIAVLDGAVDLDRACFQGANITRNEDFINPLNLSRAISTAIEQGANIIHCAACHPTQSGLAHEFIDKAIRQAQDNNILVIAPGGNDKGECWCVPAVLDNVLTVGAMKDTGEPFKFSNFGGKYASQGILAPGENIIGAQPGTDEPIRKKGTSCAAPIRPMHGIRNFC